MLLSLETVKHLSRPRPLLSGGYLVLEWALLVATLVALSLHPEPWLLVLAVPWVGARQLALLELLHGCVHWSLFRNSRLNDLVGESLLAWPLMLALEPMRQRHLAHHRYLNTLADPEWDPRPGAEPTRARRLRGLLTELSGIGSIRRGLDRLRHPLPAGQRLKRGHRLMRALAYAFCLGAAIAGGKAWLLLALWIVPRFTWVPFVQALREAYEHAGMRDRVPSQRTRSIRCGFLLRTFVLPGHAGYHEAHHLYPSVPFHALPALQEALRAAGGVREPENLVTLGGFGRTRMTVQLPEISRPEPARTFATVSTRLSSSTAS